MNQQLDHYQCSACKARYPNDRKDCFYCGKADTIIFNQIRKKPKQKKFYYGATINIRVN